MFSSFFEFKENVKTLIFHNSNPKKSDAHTWGGQQAQP